jgi:prepilin-type N-terminal cleavage/methylation domain-containing protein
MENVSTTRPSGFTIVELLIVIVVIAILATISVVAYNGVQDRARVTAANAELKTLEKAITLARINQGGTLMEVTGHGCTGCVGTQAQTNLSLDAISAASGANLSPLKDGDPWGNMYYIDENEGEGGNCNMDWIGVNPGHTGVPGISIAFYRCP